MLYIANPKWDWIFYDDVYDIQRFLIRIGLQPSFTGYRYVVWMLWQMQQDQTGVYDAVTNLYVDGARHFGVSIASLERATRTVIKDIWNSNNQGILETLYGRKLHKPFSNSQFLSNAILFMALESAQKKRQEGTPINRPENISAQTQKEAPVWVPLS